MSADVLAALLGPNRWADAFWVILREQEVPRLDPLTWMQTIASRPKQVRKSRRRNPKQAKQKAQRLARKRTRQARHD